MKFNNDPKRLKRLADAEDRIPELNISDDMLRHGYLGESRGVTCKQCGHNWDPRVPNPTSCPKCKSYQWNVANQSVKGDAR